MNYRDSSSLFQQGTALSLEPLSLARHSSSSFRTTHLPPPRLPRLVRLQPQASRVASSSPIHLREPSSIHQEPSIPKTIPPRPPSLPTTACRPLPSPPQGTSPARDTPRLQAAQSPLLQELLTRTPATAPLTVRATLSQALDTGKGEDSGCYQLSNTPNLYPICGSSCLEKMQETWFTALPSPLLQILIWNKQPPPQSGG